MKIYFFIPFILFTSLAYSQDLCKIDVQVFHTTTKEKLQLVEVELIKESKLIDNSVIDFDGNFTLIIGSINFESDSLYFCFAPRGTNSSIIKFYLNDLKLMGETNVGDYSLKLEGYNYYTFKEYEKYRKVHKIMPGRKNTKAIDIH